MAIKEKGQIVYKENPNGGMRYIDFAATFAPHCDTQYEKTLIQPVKPEEYVIGLNKYFTKHNKYNIYSLALHFGMSKYRFEKHYLKSEDPQIKHLSQMALDYIMSHAFDNEEDYKRTLRFMISYAETGKMMVELSEEAQDISANKIVMIPMKEL